MKLSFYMPTKVIMGKECIEHNKELFLSQGKRTLIVTGRKSAAQNGSLADVVKVLEQQGIEHTLFNKVEPNPTISTVQQGAVMARECKADFIIGIGGGSALDAAKGIAVLALNSLEGDSIFTGPYENPVLPLFAVPTTAGTGSEVTPYSILTDQGTKRKRNLATPGIFPVTAFLDARYTLALSHPITVNTGLDALSHAIEGYVSVRSNPNSDMIARESIRLLGSVLPLLTKKETGFESREILLYASMLAGQVIAQTGTTAVHAMGYSLTSFKNIDHGRANALLLSEYFTFITPAQPEKVSQVYELMNLPGHKEFTTLIDDLLKAGPGEKESLTGEEISRFASLALEEGNIKNTLPEPGKTELEKIYRNSFST